MDIIVTQDLVRQFGPAFRLGPLNLRVKAGETLGVMGPNGAGKTTLLRLLWGFGRPDSGAVQVFGLKPHLDQLRVRLRAGFVAENPQFYDSMTPLNFLHFVGSFYPNWNGARALALLDDFRIPARTLLRNISKGTRMKLALIAATAHEPALLILDEPTAGLDALIRSDILRYLKTLAQLHRTAIVLSSHISDDLDQIADSVLMLNSGKVIEYAPAAELLARYNRNRLEAVFLHALGVEHHP